MKKVLLSAIVAIMFVTGSCESDADKPKVNDTSLTAKETEEQRLCRLTTQALNQRPKMSYNDSIDIVHNESPTYFPITGKEHVYDTDECEPGYGNNGTLCSGILYNDVTGCYYIAGWHSVNGNIVSSYHTPGECHGWVWAFWASLHI